MKKKILIIDDEQLILFGLKKALSRKSFDVDTSSTAMEALQKFSISPYDLCLLDICLPDYNGLELVKIFRQMSSRTKTIIMTASYINETELSENIREAIENGACNFITKPFNLVEVTDLVSESLAEDRNFHTRKEIPS